MGKIVKIQVVHNSGHANTQVCVTRQGSFRWYGEDRPISYASQQRIEKLEQNEVIRLNSWITMKYGILLTFKRVV